MYILSLLSLPLTRLILFLWVIWDGLPVLYSSFPLAIEFESVELRWVNLGPVIQSEVSQKEKNEYHLLMYIYGI